ncbi:MAG: divergent PAP2 family protein [Spirochaetota bacterium]
MNWFPGVLATAAVVQVSCQMFKFLLYSARDGSFEFKYLVTAGGIPSAHSAFVTALTVAVAIRNGVGSDLFAVSFVFSAIVVYDAYRLRGHVQRHAEVINEEIIRPKGGREMSEMVGHSLVEIVTGVLYGGLLSAVVTLLLMA